MLLLTISYSRNHDVGPADDKDTTPAGLVDLSAYPEFGDASRGNVWSPFPPNSGGAAHSGKIRHPKHVAARRQVMAPQGENRISDPRHTRPTTIVALLLTFTASRC